MTIYIMLVFIILIEAAFIFIGKSSRVKNKVYTILVFFQLFILSGLRGRNVGSDTEVYLNLFDNIKNNIHWNEFGERFEYGYLALNRIIGYFFESSQVLLFITSFFIVGVVSLFIYKYSDNIWLSFHLFITLMFFYSSMSAIRYYIAISIILISIKYVYKEKLFKFIICVLIASLFHYTALVFIVVYYINRMKFTRRNILTIFLASIIGFISFNKILSIGLSIFPQYVSYLTTSYIGETQLSAVINLIISICLLLLGLILDKKHETLFKYKHMEKIGYSMLLLQIFFAVLALRASLFIRFYNYFAIFNIIYIPMQVKKIKDINLKYIYIYGVWIVSFLYNIIILVYKPEWNILVPYKTFISM